MRLIKLSLLAACGLLLLLVVATGVIIAANNTTKPLPDKARLAASLQAGIGWMEANADEMLRVENPILWYFVLRSAQLSGDSRLAALTEAHRAKYLAPRRGNYIWGAMFNPDAPPVPLSFDQVNELNYYSQHMVYALNCDTTIGRLASIQAQNGGEFCGPAHVLRPTCTTHQLMGIRFLQQTQCGDAEKNAETVRQLQRMVAREIALDPRVLDLYIQRALMLVESGNVEAVKGIWIHKILTQQHADGGWGNFQPLVRLSDDRFIGLGYGQSRTGKPRAGKTVLKLFSLGRPTSTFHATAQGVLLTALLVHDT